MNIILDEYTWKARVYPLFLVVLPIGLALLSLFPNGLDFWSVIWGLVVSCGGLMLLSQLGRDFGKKKEPSLFELWGGKPTLRRIRYSGNNYDVIKSLHKKMGLLDKDLKIPNKDEEEENAIEADQIYARLIEILRERTRDRKKYSLVYKENINYGFRRNLWGLKPIGVVATLAGCIFTLLVIVDYDLMASLALMVNCLFLLVWFFLINPSWVKIAAEAYADRLIGSVESVI